MKEFSRFDGRRTPINAGDVCDLNCQIEDSFVATECYIRSERQTTWLAIRWLSGPQSVESVLRWLSTKNWEKL